MTAIDAEALAWFREQRAQPKTPSRDPLAVEIPSQLQNNDGFRFILIPKGKKGGGNERDWQKTRNYAWNDPRLVTHLEQGGNYGVFPAPGSGYVILDADDYKACRDVGLLNDLEDQTFTVETGGSQDERRKFHYYFRADPPLEGKHPIDLEDGRHAGEVYAEHPETAKGYVVGPGSIHPSGERYRVDCDQPIRTLDSERFRALLARLTTKPARAPASEKERAPPRTDAHSGSLSDRLNLRVTDFLMPLQAHQRDGEWEGEHPVHGSDTGTNLTVSDETWYCRRHGTGGGPLEALAVAAGIIDCSQVGPGCLKPPAIWAKVMDALRDKGYPVDEVASKRSEATVGTSEAPITADDFARFVYKSSRGVPRIDESVVAGFIYEYHNVVSFNDVLYIYRDGIYVRDDGTIKAEVKRFVDGCGTREPLTKVLREVREHLLATNPYPSQPFNHEPDLIPVANGVILLDCETGEIEQLPHSPAYRFTYKLPVAYDPTATADLALEVLGKYVVAEDVPLLVQPFAQALLQAQIGMPYKKNYLLQGNRHGGKSTYTKIIEGFFGAENISRVTLQEITTNRFSYARLENRLINYHDDLSTVPLEYTGKFKAVTGSCDHDIEDKFEKKHGGRITCPHVFTCNRPPKVSDAAKTDDAWWERWEYVRFPFTFPVDPTFEARTLTPAFYTSLLRAVLDMMIEIRRSGHLTINRTSAEVQERWNVMADPLYQFLDTKMERQQLAMHDYDKGKLWRAYLVWCEEANIDQALRHTTLTAFTKALQPYGLVHFETSRMIDGTKVNIDCYRGQWKWRGPEEMGPGTGGGAES